MTITVEKTPWGTCRRYFDERKALIFSEYVGQLGRGTNPDQPLANTPGAGARLTPGSQSQPCGEPAFWVRKREQFGYYLQFLRHKVAPSRTN
jgi:hypothetical protein